MTGVPSKVWKTLAKDENMKSAMLAVLQKLLERGKSPTKLARILHDGTSQKG
jgi:hypothetical protein